MPAAARFLPHWTLRVSLAVLLAAAVIASGCSDDDDDDDDGNDSCNTEALPVMDHADGPVLTDIVLECQSGQYLNILATITDPQGSANLDQVNQRIVMYGRPDCEGTLQYEVTDDVSSGQEESFGIVLERDTNPALFDSICAAPNWPVEVHLMDIDAHHTLGIVLARVID